MSELKDYLSTGFLLVSYLGIVLCGVYMLSGVWLVEKNHC